MVRGRVFDQSKPQTFNQPWTGEEQKRLEELLEEYPSEEVEMERWKKIATCLGNRTPIQVILLLVTSATYCHILVFFKDNSARIHYHAQEVVTGEGWVSEGAAVLQYLENVLEKEGQNCIP